MKSLFKGIKGGLYVLKNLQYKKLYIVYGLKNNSYCKY